MKLTKPVLKSEEIQHMRDAILNPVTIIIGIAHSKLNDHSRDAKLDLEAILKQSYRIAKYINSLELEEIETNSK